MFILLENGDRLLLESGDAFLLEDSAPPAPPGIGVLLLENGFSFLLEDGSYLLLEDGGITPPPPDPDRPSGFGPMLATPYLFGPRRPRAATDDEDEESIAIMALIAARR
jgi:hypothetical protein